MPTTAAISQTTHDGGYYSAHQVTKDSTINQPHDVIYEIPQQHHELHFPTEYQHNDASSLYLDTYGLAVNHGWPK